MTVSTILVNIVGGRWEEDNNDGMVIAHYYSVVITPILTTTRILSLLLLMTVEFYFALLFKWELCSSNVDNIMNYFAYFSLNFTLNRIDGMDLGEEEEILKLSPEEESKLLKEEGEEEVQPTSSLPPLPPSSVTTLETWGLTPKISLWMYTSIIRPAMEYGALVWCPATRVSSHMTHLERAQRNALLV